jgi:3-oxoacyl-[acyl-carrier-protein] synthase II
VLQLRHQKLHPTVNHEAPDASVALDFVKGSARDCRIRTALSNSFGFGGHNACLIFGLADL